MAVVIVSFQAPGDVYQSVIERDIEFHEQEGHLSHLRILVESNDPAVIDLTKENDSVMFDGLTGDGTAASPYQFDGPTDPLIMIDLIGDETAADPPVCAICQDPVGRVRRMLPCGHLYDQSCIRRWFGGRSGRAYNGRRPTKPCPVCNMPFERSAIC